MMGSSAVNWIDMGQGGERPMVEGLREGPRLTFTLPVASACNTGVDTLNSDIAYQQART